MHLACAQTEVHARAMTAARSEQPGDVFLIDPLHALRLRLGGLSCEELLLLLVDRGLAREDIRILRPDAAGDMISVVVPELDCERR